MILPAIRFQLDPDSVWSNIKSVGMLEFVRQMDSKTRVETRYFISDVEDNTKRYGNSIRIHWGIENSSHWVLYVALREDNCRIKKDNARQDFAVMRQIAVNLLGKEKCVKRGIKK
jgi:predicted transposase YbfD/YdcC